MTTYTIKPLVWKKATDDVTLYLESVVCAVTVIGQLHVWSEPNSPCRFRWSITGGLSHDCDSIEDGKAKAEKYYIERLMAALTPTPTG